MKNIRGGGETKNVSMVRSFIYMNKIVVLIFFLELKITHTSGYI